MELLAELFFTAMAIVVQLGVPVVVIFVAAFVADRDRRRRLDPRGAGSQGASGPLARFVAWVTAEEEEPHTPRVARTSLCPSGGGCATPSVQVGACWQAMKAENGRLRSECVGCQSFLSSTTAG